MYITLIMQIFQLATKECKIRVTKQNYINCYFQTVILLKINLKTPHVVESLTKLMFCLFTGLHKLNMGNYSKLLLL